MADETKPLDRDKPFKRINNGPFKVETPPNGDGVARGCQTPEGFGDFTKEFEEFLKKKLGAVGVLSDIFNTVRDVIQSAKNVLAATVAILEALKIALAGLGVATGFIGTLLALAAVASAVAAAANALLSTIADTTQKVLEDFFIALAKTKVLPRAVRVIPQWVPVRGGFNTRVTDDQVIEVEGVCTRSFGNPIDVPFFNWHLWFDWNVQIQPEPEYAKALSPAPDPPNQEGFESERPLNRNNSFEIQCDPGSLFADRLRYRDGFPATQMPANDGPIDDNFDLWPTAGLFVWASGRWVYDCSRVTPGKNPQMCAMINPAKAVATARWQAFSFQENEAAVPAIQFMFLASRRGGQDVGNITNAQLDYIGYKAINDTDYEFIVDLPPIEAPTSPFPVGHTFAHKRLPGELPDFPHNTIVLRPRMLKDVRPLTLIGSAVVAPLIQPILGDDPTQPPKQVKITIPLTSLGPEAETCGFILSLGWFDPNQEQARKVKLCKVEVNGFSGRLQIRDSPFQKLRKIFKNEEDGLKKKIKEEIENIKILDITIPILNEHIVLRLKDVPLLGPLIDGILTEAMDAFINGLIKLFPLEKEEWLMRIGINGHWKCIYLDGVGSDPISLREPKFEAVRDKLTYNFALAQGDPLLFSMHGSEFDPVGDIMHSSRENRLMTINNQPVPWNIIADPGTDKQIRRELVFQYVLKVMTDTTEGLGKLSLGFDNEPLGQIDGDLATKGESTDSNPMIVKNSVQPTEITRTALFARSTSDQAILAESTNKPDYRVQYTLEIKDQIEASAQKS